MACREESPRKVAYTKRSTCWLCGCQPDSRRMNLQKLTKGPLPPHTEDFSRDQILKSRLEYVEEWSGSIRLSLPLLGLDSTLATSGLALLDSGYLWFGLIRLWLPAVRLHSTLKSHILECFTRADLKKSSSVWPRVAKPTPNAMNARLDQRWDTMFEKS